MDQAYQKFKTELDDLPKHLDTTAIIETVTQVHKRLWENYPCPKADDYRHLIPDRRKRPRQV